MFHHYFVAIYGCNWTGILAEITDNWVKSSQVKSSQGPSYEGIALI